MTNGFPSSGQNPCDVVSELYEPANIQILPVGVGFMAALGSYYLNCMASEDFTAMLIGDYSSTIIQDTLQISITDCNAGAFLSG